MIQEVAPPPDPYLAFLEAKAVTAPRHGFDVDEGAINPILKGHQRAMVRWGCSLGCAAYFASFGLGKTMVELETARLVRNRFGGLALIVIPLGVRQEFVRDARTLGVKVKFIRRIEETVGEADSTVFLTNYETIRDGKLDPRNFTVALLDEASVLRGFGGTKTFREFMRLFEAVPYKFVATATPSPNEFIELLAYAAFLGVMDVGQAKTRFFKRNSEKADTLTLHPHKEREFWLWVASWGLFVSKPSDLGFSDDGYCLPPIEVHWHEVGDPVGDAGAEKSGQRRMFKAEAVGLVEAAREKRASLPPRIAKLMEIRAEDPGAHRLIWHDLEDERRALERAIPHLVTVFGTEDLDVRERKIVAFSEGEVQELAAKPVLAGSGCNFQRHCAWAVFLGIGFKFNDFIQAIHRIQRFLQTRTVRLDLIYSSAERGVRAVLEEKWRKHEELVATMTDIVREYGLTDVAMAGALKRALFDQKQRVEVAGAGFTCIHNDCVLELRRMPADSVDLVVTSIPFSTQYEYTPSYNDFGHTDSNEHFFEQMGFLLPELYRVLRPGRVAAIHVKDRIVPGGLTGLGFQTVYPFADDVRLAFRKAGFAYLGEKTNLTDVVRENNQTYRLGWSEQLKDGSRMGCGVPEKVLLFRRPPTDPSTGYADKPVAKERPVFVDRDGFPAEYTTERRDIAPVPGTGYSRGRWQLDAHHLMRTDGDRLVTAAEWATWDNLDEVYKLWKRFNLAAVYDFEHHVRVAENLDQVGKLPPIFMLMPPHSWHPEVWTDIMQALSMNTLAAGKGAEKHLCPMPFMIADRLITQFSMPGETVLDPFGGLMTIPYECLKLGRRGIGIELNPTYFLDGVKYCEARAREMAVPTLFDLLEERPLEVTEVPTDDVGGFVTVMSEGQPA